MHGHKKIPLTFKTPQLLTKEATASEEVEKEEEEEDSLVQSGAQSTRDRSQF